MKSAYIEIEAGHLAKGLRRESDAELNDKTAAQTITNLIADASGLRAYEPVTRFATLPEDLEWPHPQLFRSRRRLYLVYTDSIYEFEETDIPASAVDWLTAKLVAFEYLDAETVFYPADSAEPWHFVDMGPTWMLIRPDVVLFKMNVSGLHVNTGPLGHIENYLLACSDRTVNTGCYCNGRVILGGFDKTDLFGAAQWTDFWNEWWGELPESFAPVTNLINADRNWVWWSTIGGGADVWMFFYPQLILDGVLKGFGGGDGTKSPFIDALKRNEMGFMPMEWSGDVLVVKPLGSAGDFVVYGDNGITLMQHITDPFPGFGRIELLRDEGIAGRDMVGGTNEEHVFITTGGDLYRLTAEPRLERIGCSEYFVSYMDYYYRFGYDQKYKRHYITAGDNAGAGVYQSFVLSSTGLTQYTAQEAVSSCFRLDGDLVGISSEAATASVTYTSGWFDMGSRGFKKVTAVEIGLTVDSGVTLQGYVHARYDPDTEHTFGPVDADKNGIYYIDAAGVDFYITFVLSKEGDNSAYENCKIDSIKIWYQLDDYRLIRGTKAG